MQIRWTLHTNAKSEKNAQVLLNQVCRLIDATPNEVTFDGDRYSGHQIRFILKIPALTRAEQLYWLLTRAEKIANSWTLSAITAPAHGWSHRSRVAGIKQIEWCEWTDES